jgi:hypothetical protein
MEILLISFKRKKSGKGQQGVDMLAVNNCLGLGCIAPPYHAKSESCTELNSSGNILTPVNP